MAAVTYPVAIPSLAHSFPALSEISGIELHMVNESKKVGDPFDVNAAYSAECTVNILEQLTRK